MSGYRLSVLAEIDLAEIADYTTDRWGASQAERYLDSLVTCFKRIAEMPTLAALRDGSRGLPPHRAGKAYRLLLSDVQGVFISRILHCRMLPTSDRLLDG